jgi:3-hydroxyacyl-CoA dehydrogenase/enoyl-CoA hydratase/3-hydroxybutyryl-CoA epimerase
MIENAGKAAGMPVDPFSLHDEVAIDLMLKIVKAAKAEVGAPAVDPHQGELLVRMVEKEGRLGRKNRKGFYDYPENGAKRLWPGLRDLQPRQLVGKTLDFEALQRRLLVTQALEAARTVEEGVVTDPREVDVGSILGFAPFTCGALCYIDFMGAKAFVDLCRSLQRDHGDRFAPNAMLVEMADKGGSFYGPARTQRRPSARPRWCRQVRAQALYFTALQHELS